MTDFCLVSILENSTPAHCLCVCLCVYTLCKVYILGRLMRSYSAIDLMIKYIVNILSENLGAKNLSLTHQHTAEAITIENMFVFLYQSQ